MYNRNLNVNLNLYYLKRTKAFRFPPLQRSVKTFVAHPGNPLVKFFHWSAPSFKRRLRPPFAHPRPSASIQSPLPSPPPRESRLAPPQPQSRTPHQHLRKDPSPLSMFLSLSAKPRRAVPTIPRPRFRHPATAPSCPGEPPWTTSASMDALDPAVM
jgi:hypothetical protein